MAVVKKNSSKSEAFRQELLSQIFSGELKVGMRIPTCRQLSKNYNISYVTVTRVIGDLARDGFLKTRHGSGTVVKKVDSKLPLQNTPLKIILYSPVISRKMWYKFIASEPELKNGFHSQFVNEYKSLLPSDMPSQCPDIIYTADNLINTMATTKKLMPLNDIIEKYNIDLKRYPPNIIKQMTYNGNIYALPICFSTISVFYNKSLFQQCGVPLPKPDWTWADFIKLAKKMTVRDASGRINFFGFTPFIQMSCLESFLLQGIPENMDVYEALASKKHLDGIKFFLDLTRKHQASPSLQNNEDFVIDLFLNTQTAMIVGKSSFIKKLKDTSFEWDIVPLPVGRRKCSTCSVQGFGISSEAQDISSIVHVLKKLTGETMQKIIQEDFGHLPAYEDMAKQVPYSSSFISQIDDSFNINYNYANNKDKMNNLIYKMFIDFLKPKDFITELNTILDPQKTED